MTKAQLEEAARIISEQAKTDRGMVGCLQLAYAKGVQDTLRALSDPQSALSMKDLRITFPRRDEELPETD